MLIVFMAVVLVIGIVLLIKADDRDGIMVAGISFTVSGAVLFIACIIGLLLGPFEDRSKIAEFNATRATVEAARANTTISAIELAAIQQKVVEMNQWLASVQYQRRNPWVGIFNAPEVLDIKPIK